MENILWSPVGVSSGAVIRNLFWLGSTASSWRRVQTSQGRKKTITKLYYTDSRLGIFLKWGNLLYLQLKFFWSVSQYSKDAKSTSCQSKCYSSIISLTFLEVVISTVTEQFVGVWSNLHWKLLQQPCLEGEKALQLFIFKSSLSPVNLRLALLDDTVPGVPSVVRDGRAGVRSHQC